MNYVKLRYTKLFNITMEVLMIYINCVTCKQKNVKNEDLGFLLLSQNQQQKL